MEDLNAKNKKYDIFKKFASSEYAIIGILFLLIIIAAPLVPQFLTIQNFSNILSRMTIIAIAAIGMTFVIITGGIDLSIGGTVVFCSYVGVQTLIQVYHVVFCSYVGVQTLIQVYHMNVFLAALIMLVIGGIIGAINGFSVVALGMPPFIATLAMMNITRGLAHFIYQAKTIYGLPSLWSVFGTGKLLGIPITIIIYIILFIIGFFVLNYTVFGRAIYAVGSNKKAAWLAGIEVRRTTFLAYVISGVTAGASAVILSSRLASVVGSLGFGLELDVISAVVIGGISLMGGEGTILGSLVGAIMIITVGNVLVLAQVSPFFTLVAKGLVLWLAVLLDMIRKGYVFRKQAE